MTTVAETTETSVAPTTIPLVKQRMTLYDVTVAGTLIEQALIENGGELTAELEAAFDELLRQGPEKIEAACFIVRELEESEAASKNEEKRMAERRKGFARNLDVLKTRVLAAVDAAFSGKLKTARFTVWGQNAAKPKPSVSFLAQPESLEHLHNARPDIVKQVVAYQIDEAAVLAIWEEERAEREANLAAHAEYHAAIADAQAHGRRTDLIAEPAAFQSRIPEVIAVEEREGTRFLRIK